MKIWLQPYHHTDFNKVFFEKLWILSGKQMDNMLHIRLNMKGKNFILNKMKVVVVSLYISIDCHRSI